MCHYNTRESENMIRYRGLTKVWDEKKEQYRAKRTPCVGVFKLDRLRGRRLGFRVDQSSEHGARVAQPFGERARVDAIHTWHALLVKPLRGCGRVCEMEVEQGGGKIIGGSKTLLERVLLEKNINMLLTVEPNLFVWRGENDYLP